MLPEIMKFSVGTSKNQSQQMITDLLCKGKYHCMADALFDWFGISCFAYDELTID